MKFRQGDQVIKARRYSEDVYCKFGGGPTGVPLGTMGKIERMDGRSEAIVKFRNGHRWWVSTKELDHEVTSFDY